MRKSVKGKGKLKAAKEPEKKLGRKLKKLKPKNAVDLAAVSSIKKLDIDVHGVNMARRFADVFMGSSPTAGGGRAGNLASIVGPDGKTLAELIVQMRDGLPARRLDAIASIRKLIELDDRCLSLACLRLLSELSTRLIDDEADVRRYAMNLAVQGIVRRVDGMQLRALLMMQFQLTLTQLKQGKRLDGIVYIYSCLKELASPVLQDQKFIHGIMPLFLNVFLLALNPAGPAVKYAAPVNSFKNPLLQVLLSVTLLSFYHVTNIEPSSGASAQEQQAWGDTFSLIDPLKLARRSPTKAVPTATLQPKKKQKFEDWVGVKQINKPAPITKLVAGACGLARMADAEKTNPPMAGKLATLATALMRWCVGIAHLRLEVTKQASVAPPLPLTRSSAAMVDMLMTTGEGEHLSVSRLVRYNRQQFLRTIEQLRELAVVIDDAVLGFEVILLLVQLIVLLECSQEISEAQTNQLKATALQWVVEFERTGSARLERRTRKLHANDQPNDDSTEDSTPVGAPPPVGQSALPSIHRMTLRTIMKAFGRDELPSSRRSESDSIHSLESDLGWLRFILPYLKPHTDGAMAENSSTSPTVDPIAVDA